MSNMCLPCLNMYSCALQANDGKQPYATRRARTDVRRCHGKPVLSESYFRRQDARCVIGYDTQLLRPCFVAVVIRRISPIRSEEAQQERSKLPIFISLKPLASTLWLTESFHFRRRTFSFKIRALSLHADKGCALFARPPTRMQLRVAML
jgi:hypothetical protein